MEQEQMRGACALLVQHWANGTQLAALPPELRPEGRAEAYAVQACIEAYTSEPLYGWKIAATSLAGQRHIGVDGPLTGRILAERVIADGGDCPLGGNLMKVAELEFAFRMAGDLAPRDDSAAAAGGGQSVDLDGAPDLSRIDHGGVPCHSGQHHAARPGVGQLEQRRRR